MKVVFGNFNWLVFLLISSALILGITKLPPILGAVNAAILIAAGILVVFSSSKSLLKGDLELERKRLNIVINSAREGIVAYDQNFKILIFNPAAEEIFNVKASEILGQSFTLKIKEGIQPRLRPLLTVLFPTLAQSIVRRTEPGSYPQIADISFEEPNLEIRITTNRIIDDAGNVLGFVKLITDRTRELALLRSKSEFITIASHQLRTPLSGLKWAVESLKNEPLPENQKDVVVNAAAAVNQLSKIVDDLLEVAKIEEGRFGYKFQEMDLTAFIEDALTQTKPIANQYRVRLYFDKPKEAIPKITADPQKLAMALSNLLDNAIKYNISNGEVIVKIEKDAKNPYLQISVKDTGIGIAGAESGNVFKKFFRAENAVRIAVDGTGLGLYIVKNIIRRHGGQIWVETTLNRGTTVYFTLPTNPTLIPAKEFIYDE